ncbi:MAG: TadE/TadG family type IV pilus assembly protein [Acidimicrobiia bacterium]
MTGDRGTAAIEFAFAIVVLLMLALGAYEWGTGFSDRISMTAAVREGGRVGSAAGDLPDADCRIIEAAAGALQGVSGNNVKELWIYQSDENGAVTPNRQVYVPDSATDPELICSGGSWFRTTTGWPPSARVNSGSDRDWLGVKVIVDHEWRTGFLWWDGTVEWEEDAVFHLEPGVVS